MLADEETMSYNRAWGGTIAFPEEKWADWYERWVVRTEGKRFYRYVTSGGGAFVGEIAYHYDGEIGGFSASVIIHAKYRGAGWGGQALDALCQAAKENGLTRLYDDIAAGNTAIRLFERHGFAEIRRTGGTVLLMKEL